VVFATSVHDSSNFFNFNILVLSTLVMVKSLNVAELVIGNKYLVGIRACDPYINWKGVWHVPILKAVL
jgi:hypothetical protein